MKILIATTGWFDKEIINLCEKNFIGCEIVLLHWREKEKKKWIHLDFKQYLIDDLLVDIKSTKKIGTEINDILLSCAIHFWKGLTPFKIDMDEIVLLEKINFVLFEFLSKERFDNFYYEGYNGALNKLLALNAEKLGLTPKFLSGSVFLPHPLKNEFFPHRYFLKDRFENFYHDFHEKTLEKIETNEEYRRIKESNLEFFEKNLSWYGTSNALGTIKIIINGLRYFFKKSIEVKLLDKLIFNIENYNQFHSNSILRRKISNIFQSRLRYSKIDEEKKSVIFFLQYQPEQTSHGQAGQQFFETTHILEVLNHLPSNYILYIKDHFALKGNRIRSEFHLLNSFHNIKFIDPKTPSSYILSRQNIIIATYNGSVGLEAAVKNIPVITMIDTYYIEFETVVNWYKCNKNIEEIIQLRANEHKNEKIFRNIFNNTILIDYDEN